MNQRYIAIEHNSGFIWGDALAATPEEACTAIDRQADPTIKARPYTGVPPIRDTNGGYHLYVAPTDFPETDDGMCQELIDRVAVECRYCGDYRPVASE